MDKLAMLKRDLQLLTNANDDFLIDLLNAADKFIKTEGIKDDGGAEYTQIQVQYAAYLFRRRAGSDTGMPRFLRYEMNNLLFSQKARS